MADCPHEAPYYGLGRYIVPPDPEGDPAYSWSVDPNLEEGPLRHWRRIPGYDSDTDPDMAAVMAQGTNKRKRETQDIPDIRQASSIGPNAAELSNQFLDDMADNAETPIDFTPVAASSNATVAGTALDRLKKLNQEKASNSGNASDTASAALAFTMTIPETTEKTFMNQVSENSSDPSIKPGLSSDVDFGGAASGNDDSHIVTPSTGSKPLVGSDEWHKQRKDNHKEVERRRRETINEGINELAKIVPDCEKNKGSILARAVQFITQLKTNEEDNINRWSMEKLLTEQAIAELSETCDKLKAECQRAWRECEQWKAAAEKAGISIDTSDKAKSAEDDA